MTTIAKIKVSKTFTLEDNKNPRGYELRDSDGEGHIIAFVDSIDDAEAEAMNYFDDVGILVVETEI